MIDLHDTRARSIPGPSNATFEGWDGAARKRFAATLEGGS
jgi:hypothetical protein